MYHYRPVLLDPRPQVAEAINYVVNHDAKAAAYIGLNAIGPVTGVGLASDISKRTDLTYEDCRAFVKDYPKTFAKKGFAEAFQAQGENGRPAMYYRAARMYYALPLAGTLLEWAERFDASLISALGYTSHENSSGSVNTIQIFDRLLHGIQPGQMELPGYTSRDRYGRIITHNSRFKTLIELGYVELEGAAHTKTSRYTIAPDFQIPAANLVERVTRISNGEHLALRDGRDFASHVYNTPSLLARVMLRGMANSSHGSGMPKPTPA